MRPVRPPTASSRGDLAQQAGSLLGLELEGLSPPDQEFETARQLVRFAGSAYRHAAWAPRNMSPSAAARSAAARAARRYAPGLWRRTGRRGLPAPDELAGRPLRLPLARYPFHGSPATATPTPRRTTGAASVRGRSQPAYGRPAYAPSYGAPPDAGYGDEPGGYGPNGYDVATPSSSLPSCSRLQAWPGHPSSLEPVAVAGPSRRPSHRLPPAGRGRRASGGHRPGHPAAEPASTGELGGEFAASGRWPPSAGSRLSGRAQRALGTTRPGPDRPRRLTRQRAKGDHDESVRMGDGLRVRASAGGGVRRVRGDARRREPAARGRGDGVRLRAARDQHRGGARGVSRRPGQERGQGRRADSFAHPWARR